MNEYIKRNQITEIGRVDVYSFNLKERYKVTPCSMTKQNKWQYFYFIQHFHLKN